MKIYLSDFEFIIIKKADIALFFIILIIGLAVSYFTFTGSQAGDQVKITVAGQLYGTYPLTEDREIEVAQNGHLNNIIIKDGVVSMASSDCKNQICVNTRPISHTKDSIVCLPNKVMVETEARNGGGDVDVITG